LAESAKKRALDPSVRAKARAAYAAKKALKPKPDPKPPTPKQLALAAGLIKYDGLPCPNCGKTLRYSKSNCCVNCSTIKQQSPKIKEYKKQYLIQNHERLRPKKRQNYVARRSELLEKAREWVRNNPEKRRAIALAYKAKRKTQLVDGDSPSVVSRWIKTAAKVCYWCGKHCRDQYHVDHYVPLAKGGKHIVSNLVIACPTCNMSKNASDPYEYAASLGRLF